MENSPMPMFETERNGLGRECEESLGVAAMQLVKEAIIDDIINTEVKK